jgi:hypothetical protein
MEKKIISDFTEAYGFVTQEKFIRDKSLAEIERILGFQSGRFLKGVAIYALTQLPKPSQFQFAGYTQVADHRLAQAYGNTSLSAPAKGESRQDFDKRILKIKTNIISNVWATAGSDRLVKLRPLIEHNQNMSSDEQYPPGAGVPQWKLIDGVSARLVCILEKYPSEFYRPMR